MNEFEEAENLENYGNGDSLMGKTSIDQPTFNVYCMVFIMYTTFRYNKDPICVHVILEEILIHFTH